MQSSRIYKLSMHFPILLEGRAFSNTVHEFRGICVRTEDRKRKDFYEFGQLTSGNFNIIMPLIKLQAVKKFLRLFYVLNFGSMADAGLANGDSTAQGNSSMLPRNKKITVCRWKANNLR